MISPVRRRVRCRLSGRGGMAVLVGLVLLAACDGPEPAAPVPPAAAADETPLLTLAVADGTGRATHRPTGRTFTLFEDERLEGSDEGTTHTLLSSFGPYVSYRTEWYYEGGAHPSYGTAYRAVVVGDTLTAADLRQLFSEEALYEALRRTPLAHDLAPAATTLGALLDALAERYECEMDVGGFYSSFFVREATADSAAVVVGLTHGCEVARGTFTTIPLRLPIPPDTEDFFDDFRLFANLRNE